VLPPTPLGYAHADSSPFALEERTAPYEDHIEQVRNPK